MNNNAQQKPRRGIVQISEVANGLIDPVLAKRAGINTMLLGSWDEIAGAEFAECTRPERIAWPRRASEMAGEGGGYQPGVLTIACEGARALFLSHQQGEIIQRINGFFGFPAVNQIKIVQKPVSIQSNRRPKPRPRWCCCMKAWAASHCGATSPRGWQMPPAAVCSPGHASATASPIRHRCPGP